ncbi:hypothetical protein [Burkholderia contaminans]|uniref:hypothetical protein n=1 Tax=Burkholderia contaminans TaxID=488447 RepID=UPI0015889508|nr:hypothetical protein [Burkholderia contaminans]
MIEDKRQAALDRQEEDFQRIAEANKKYAADRNIPIVDPIIINELDRIINTTFKTLVEGKVSKEIFIDYDYDKDVEVKEERAKKKAEGSAPVQPGKKLPTTVQRSLPPREAGDSLIKGKSNYDLYNEFNQKYGNKE